MWSGRITGETQPCVCHTLRTNYGRDLNVFLATCPSDGVQFKLANHRDGGQRLGWRFRANPEFPWATSAFAGSYSAIDDMWNAESVAFALRRKHGETQVC